MKKIALEFINLISSHGFEAYIVGGFVRDYLIDIKSIDIDIATNATPKEIKEIFKNVKFPKLINNIDNNYGSITVIYKNIEFEVTTYRKELEYFDNRHPNKIIYINDLKTDLLRRDFTINTLCFDKYGNLVDLLNGLKDLKLKKIVTVQESVKSFTDDALRILRALRFATTLDFTLDNNIIDAILKCKHLLKNISYERKKKELDKIFTNTNAKKGIQLIKKLELEDALELKNLDLIQDYTDLIGIWSIINSTKYPFTKHEKELIKKVNEVYKYDKIDPIILYKYGLYVCLLAFTNKNFKKQDITKQYNILPIKNRLDINITADEICDILNKAPSAFLNTIFTDLEEKILTNKLKNINEDIKKYLIKNY